CVNGIPIGAAKPFQSRSRAGGIGRACREHDALMRGGEISVLSWVKHGSVRGVFSALHEMQHTPIKTAAKNNPNQARTRPRENRPSRCMSPPGSVGQLLRLSMSLEDSFRPLLRGRGWRG